MQLDSFAGEKIKKELTGKQLKDFKEEFYKSLREDGIFLDSDSKSIGDLKSVVNFKIMGKNTVKLTKVSKKVAVLEIPSSVTVNGTKYRITSIGGKVFKNNKKLRTVVIPVSVKKIGKQAFYGCSNLKKITIRSKSLTKKNVGAKAFKGINSKAVIKVPKKQLKYYQKILKVRGIGTNITVKN